MKRILCTGLFVVSMLVSALACAQIEIHKLPETKPATFLPLGSHALTAADADAWLDGLFPYALHKNNLASAVVVVVKDGQILLSRGYGYADVATKKPVNPATTLFRPGSIAKTLLWTAVMQLVENGKLNLDADVNQYLDFRIPPRDGKPVTLRELMTHTAGFEETDKNLFAYGKALPMSNGVWLKSWVPTRVFAPGVVSAYSNYGAALAGYIVQRVSGESYEAYITQHILQPLGMRHATFRQPLPANLAGDMAKGYSNASGEAKPFELVIPVPAGGMSVSGEDMAPFMIAQLQGGQYQGASILQPATVQQMQDYTHYSVPDLLPIALGFYHMDRNGHRIIGHAGDTQFFHSLMLLYPQQDVGVFVSIVGDSDGGLRQQLLREFTDRYFPGLTQLPQKTLVTARAHGAMLVGHYLASRGSFDNFMALGNLLQPRIVMASDGTLVTTDFKDLAGQPRRWREIKPFLWLDDASGSHLGALIQNGRLRWISFDEISPVMVLMPANDVQTAAWNLPLLLGALTVLLLTVLLWPVAALVRRRCGKPLGLHAAARHWYRASRIAALLSVLFAAGWAAVVMRFDDSIANANDSFDPVLRAVQLVGVLAILASVAVLMNLVHAWRTPGGWWRKLNSAALLLACVAMIWFAFSLHLLSLHLNY